MTEGKYVTGLLHPVWHGPVASKPSMGRLLITLPLWFSVQPLLAASLDPSCFPSDLTPTKAHP